MPTADRRARWDAAKLEAEREKDKLAHHEVRVRQPTVQGLIALERWEREKAERAALTRRVAETNARLSWDGEVGDAGWTAHLKAYLKRAGL